jgi:hypothetical protein
MLLAIFVQFSYFPGGSEELHEIRNSQYASFLLQNTSDGLMA